MSAVKTIGLIVSWMCLFVVSNLQAATPWIIELLAAPAGIWLLGVVFGAIFGRRVRRVDVYHHRDPRR